MKKSDNFVDKHRYGDRVTLKYRENPNYSTYAGMKQSKLIVSTYLTCACEAMAWGKIILFCDYSFDKKYADYERGIWLLNNNKYRDFSNRISKVISMKETEYIKKTHKYFRFIMDYNDSKNFIYS